MPYFSNKPVPTPGHLLPRPKVPGPAASKKEEETSLKRKIFDSLPDAGDGNIQFSVVFVVTEIKLQAFLIVKRERDGAVVRALASHQFGPGSIPRFSYDSCHILASHAVVFRGIVLPPPHKRRLWGGGNTSSLKNDCVGG